MKYCPTCNAEYFDSVYLCSDCGEELISEEEYRLIKRGDQEEHREGEEFKRIFVLENSFEADVISDILSREGIDFLITTHEETAYNGIFIPQKGWGVLGVHPRDIDHAKSLIEAIVRSRAVNGESLSNLLKEEK